MSEERVDWAVFCALSSVIDFLPGNDRVSLLLCSGLKSKDLYT